MVYKPDKEEGEDDVREGVVILHGPGIAHDVGDEEVDPEDRYDG